MSSRIRLVSTLALTGALVGGLAHESIAQTTAALDKGLTVSGQGSSFVSNFMEQCKADVKKEFGINVAYQASGSGAGRNAYINGTNDFAASDVGFTAAELPQASKKPFVYVPVAIGGIAVIYKVPGITDLKLSGPTLAKIFAGNALKWNDADIAKENPGLSLPDEVIKVVVRSDSSGTSNVFSDYLDTAGRGNWSKGTTNTFPVPAGNGIAQRGSDGVANYVGGDQGNFAITYAEASFAEERKLAMVKVINAAGQAVTPTADAITAAMAGAAANDDGTLLLNFNVTNPKAYPISTTSYLVLPQTIDKAKGDVLRTFVTYSITACQSKATKLGYAPIPASVLAVGTKALAKVNPGSAPVPTVAGAGASPAQAQAPASTTTAPASTASVAPTTKVPAKSAKTAAKKKK